MKIKVHTIDLEIPRPVKRAAILVGVPLALMLGMSAIVWAAVPNTFADGDTLSAQKMNDNFTNVDQRLTPVDAARFVATVNGKKYSVGATVYKGATSTGGPNADGTYDGAQVGGYQGAKTICETAFTPSAHMCTGEELMRSAALAVTPAPPANNGWYNHGHFAVDISLKPIRDCAGWSSNDATGEYGGLMGTNYGVQRTTCNVKRPLLCCD